MPDREGGSRSDLVEGGDAPDPEVLPRGDARFGWFAGVLEGTIGDVQELKAAVRRVSRVDVVEVDLEVDGGRFSLLVDEAPVTNERLTLAHQGELVDALQSVVDAAGRPEDVESTLRCSLVYDDHVIETLFAPQDGELRPVSRRRELAEKDRLDAPEAKADASAVLAQVATRRGLVLGGLLLLGFGLLAWKSGYVALLRDGLFAAGAEDLELRSGVFGDSLELEVEQRRGMYLVKVERGEGYPTTAEEVEALLDEAKTAQQRAAANAVANGADVYLVLEDAEGDALGAAELRLGPLLRDDPEAQVVSLRARAGSAAVVVDLDPRVELGGRERQR